MIWESWYWRSDLTKFAASLRRRQNQKRWPDPALARCEQTIMVGFFYVRKLIESKKLSRDFAEQTVKVLAYPSQGTHVHWHNRRSDLDELFDLQNPQQRLINVENLANQLIHSYIFYLLIDESRSLKGILVASDHKRNSELLDVPLEAILDTFDLAAGGERDKAHWTTYDEKRGDFVVRIANEPTRFRSLRNDPVDHQ